MWKELNALPKPWNNLMRCLGTPERSPAWRTGSWGCKNCYSFFFFPFKGCKLRWSYWYVWEIFFEFLLGFFWVFSKIFLSFNTFRSCLENINGIKKYPIWLPDVKGNWCWQCGTAQAEPKEPLSFSLFYSPYDMTQQRLSAWHSSHTPLPLSPLCSGPFK